MPRSLLRSLVFLAGAAGIGAAAAQPGPQVPAAVPAVPPPGPVAAPPPPAASAPTRHVLAGEWRIGWPTRPGVLNLMTIETVAPFAGGLQIYGRVAADNGETCPMTGTVYDEFSGQVREGLDIRTVTMSTLVRMRVQCRASELWIEAFGLPGGPVLMSGRGTVIAGDGQRVHHPVQLGR
jgi:hypothetical protein